MINHVLTFLGVSLLLLAIEMIYLFFLEASWSSVCDGCNGHHAPLPYLLMFDLYSYYCSIPISFL
jgi:hypothetical protein